MIVCMSRRICIAFTEGLNYFLARHPDVTPRLITHFEPWHLLAYGRQAVLEMGFGKEGVSRDGVPTEYDALEAAVERGGDYPDTHFMLANLYRTTGDDRRACVEYVRAIKRNSDYERAHRALAEFVMA